MSTPNIPGLSQYPELEKKFRRRYREAGRVRDCPRCARMRVIQSVKQQIAERQRRDKKP